MLLLTASAAVPSGSRWLLSVSPEVVQSLLQISVCVSHGSLGLGLLPCCYRQVSSGARKICNQHQLKQGMENKNQCDREAAGESYSLESSSDRLRPSSSKTWDTMASLDVKQKKTVTNALRFGVGSYFNLVFSRDEGKTTPKSQIIKQKKTDKTSSGFKTKMSFDKYKYCVCVTQWCFPPPFFYFEKQYCLEMHSSVWEQRNHF